jgi:outer membrane protein assembly factor BamB
VVAYFGSFGLICFDASGQKLWELRMPLAKSFGGNAASPILVGDRVILYRGTYVDHFLLAVDRATGRELWKVPQSEPINGEMACTACPIVAGDKLIVHSARSMQAFDISSGTQIWVTKCATTATSTPVLAGNEVIVAAWNKMGEPALRPSFPDFKELIEKHDKDGDKLISRDELPTLWIFHRPEGAEAPMNGGTIGFDWVDRNKDREIASEEWSARIRELARFRAQYDTHGILAIRIDSEGVVEADKIRTLETKGIPEVPSPLCHGQYVYFVKNGGILTCLELRSGKRVYRMRTRGRGTHYASPVIADGKLFTVAGDGRISVLTLGPGPEILATNDMGDRVYATPAIVDGTIYVRTHSALFAFREGAD